MLSIRRWSLLFGKFQKFRPFSPNVSLWMYPNVSIELTHTLCSHTWCLFNVIIFVVAFFRFCMRFMYARISSHSMLIFIVLYCCLLLLKLLLLLFCWCCIFATMQHTVPLHVFVYVVCLCFFVIHWHFVYDCVPNIVTFVDKFRLPCFVKVSTWFSFFFYSMRNWLFGYNFL